MLEQEIRKKMRGRGDGEREIECVRACVRAWAWESGAKWKRKKNRRKMNDE